MSGQATLAGVLVLNAGKQIARGNSSLSFVVAFIVVVIFDDYGLSCVILVRCMRIQKRAKKPTLRIGWHIDRVRGCGFCLHAALVDQLALRDMDGLAVLMWHLRGVSVLGGVEQLIKR